MARSNGRAAAAAAVFCALGHVFLTQLAAFVTSPAPSSDSGRVAHSRLSLAATQTAMEVAKKQLKLQRWTAHRLASEGSPLAAAAAKRARQAEKAYKAAEAEAFYVQADALQAPAPTSLNPTPVASPPAAAAVSAADLAEAKKQAELLRWAAEALAQKGSAQAAPMAAKAQQAKDAYEAAKAAAQGRPAPAAPVIAAAAAPVIAAAAPLAVNQVELATAKKKVEILEWVTYKLAAESPHLWGKMKAKMDHAVAAFEALKQQARETATAVGAIPLYVERDAATPRAMPVEWETTFQALKQQAREAATKVGAIPLYIERGAAKPRATPVATPVVPASASLTSTPVASPPAAAAVSATDLAEAKKQAELLRWAASKLASEGSPLATAAAGRAKQAQAGYEAAKAAAEGRPAPAAPVIAAAAAAPVIAAAAPAAVAPVAEVLAAAAHANPSFVTAKDLAAAKKNVELLSWAARMLAAEGSPDAATMKAKMDQAVATYEAMKEADVSGATWPPAGLAASSPIAPPALAPVASTPVATPSAPASDEEVAAARKAMELHRWSREKIWQSKLGQPTKNFLHRTFGVICDFLDFLLCLGLFL